jgi:hypothetical protein
MNWVILTTIYINGEKDLSFKSSKKWKSPGVGESFSTWGNFARWSVVCVLRKKDYKKIKDMKVYIANEQDWLHVCDTSVFKPSLHYTYTKVLVTYSIEEKKIEAMFVLSSYFYYFNPNKNFSYFT